MGTECCPCAGCQGSQWPECSRAPERWLVHLRDCIFKFHFILIHLYLKSKLWQWPPVRQHSFRAVINSWLTMLS